MAPRQIIAFGGGRLFQEQDPLLLRFLLAQSRKKSPAITYVGTASGDSAIGLATFYSALVKHECRPSHLPFFARTPDLRGHVMKQDIVFVGGGNTKSMLAVWRDWGFVDVLREAYEEGIVLAGLSAGAICWFEQGITDSFAGRLCVIDCLGFLKDSCCPHYDGEPERRPAYASFIQGGEAKAGIGIDDAAAVQFVDGRIDRVVTSVPGSAAYQVFKEKGDVLERRIEADLLR